MTVEPNSPVVVAREVRMHVDLRSPDEALLDAATKKPAESIPGIEERASVSIEQVQTHGWGAAPFPATGVELAARVAIKGIPHNEGELTNDHDISVGTNLLTELVRRLKLGALDGDRS